MRLLTLLLMSLPALAAEPGIFLTHYSDRDFALTADPAAPHWRVAGVVIENDRFGKPVPGHRTEVRSRWTKDNIYILFSCKYNDLYLKPNPVTDEETNKLWEWDVAEVFVGADFDNILRYREFQMSPQGEWVDLDIDKSKPRFAEGWTWNSGMKVRARIDHASKMWFGEMMIPIRSIDARTPKAGNEMRINLYHIQGPEPRNYLAWQAVHNPSYHTPEHFGRLRLVE